MTTSTYPDTVDWLVDHLGPALGEQVRIYEAWPGPEARHEMVVLGEATWETFELAAIKTGRQHREEDYGILFDVYAFGANGSTPANPRPARRRTWQIVTVIENALADVPTPLDNPASWMQIVHGESGPRVFENGWAWRHRGTFAVHARLT